MGEEQHFTRRGKLKESIDVEALAICFVLGVRSILR